MAKNRKPQATVNVREAEKRHNDRELANYLENEAGSTVTTRTTLQEDGLLEEMQGETIEQVAAHDAQAQDTSVIPAITTSSGTTKTFVKFDLLPPLRPGKVIALRYSELMTIEETLLDGAKDVQKGLDKSNYQAMALVSAQELPPIKVQRVNTGGIDRYIVVGGYHRREAMKERLRLQYRDENGEISKEDEKKVDKAVMNELTPAREMNLLTPFELLNAVYRDNFTNGRGVTEGTRTSYGIWYFTQMAALNTPVSIREAERVAGLQHPVLVKALKALNRKEEEAKQGPATPEREQADKRERALKSLVTAIRNVAKVMGEDCTPQELDKALSGLFDKEDDDVAVLLIAESLDIAIASNHFSA